MYVLVRYFISWKGTFSENSIFKGTVSRKSWRDEGTG
jgi:hypothetical protein